jgi:hypothetical protein
MGGPDVKLFDHDNNVLTAIPQSYDQRCSM